MDVLDEIDMANSRAKRRKLSHSSEDSVPDIDADGYSTASSSGVSASTAQTYGRTESMGRRLTSPSVSRKGHVGTEERNSGPTMSNERLVAANSTGSSSIMTLQINDLLGEIRPDYEELMPGIEKTLQRLQEVILDIPDVGPMTATEAEKVLRKETGICVPFPNPRPGKDTKFTFEFKRPVQIKLVGSFQRQLGIESKDVSTVDLAATLPDSILQEKDFLNHRYFHKRAYYIAQVAAGVRRNAKNEFKLSFEYQDGITSKPTLIVEPTGSSPPGFLRPKFRVRIICAISADVFPGNKLLPAKCCRRASDDTSPTPFYNACVRSEATVELYDKLFQETAAHCDAFRDVSRLGRLWLRQRGFGGSVVRGGFGPFEWTTVCALLLRSGGAKGRPALSPRYTCLQFFKAILQFLAAKDLTDPVLLNGATCEIPRSDSPVLFDGGAQINVLFKMTPWSYQLLRQGARSTIAAFNSKVGDNFESIFVRRLDEDLLSFDQCLLLEARAMFQDQDSQGSTPKSYQKLYAVLSKALGNRVKLIHLKHDDPPKWSIDKPLKQNPKANKMIRIGLFLDSDHVDRLVDHGPLAEDLPAAAEFREFWGEKADLRRFKDGSITESLVWSEETPVTQQIISYILQRHLDLPPSAVNFLVDQVEHLVLDQSSALPRKSAFKIVNDAFQSLTTQLRQLEGLPLSIRSILPASSQLRYASLLPLRTSTPTHPIDIIIEFERSARWPDSLPAIQRTKVAFLIKLGDLLSAAAPKITTRISLENISNPASTYSNTSFLEILVPSPTPLLLPPIPFRLRIHHDRTLTLLQKALSSTISPLTRSSLTRTLQSTTRHYLATPPHTITLSRLSTLHPTLPLTISLLKTWTSSHHLTHSLPEEILEILAARPYLHPYPYTVPSSAQTAFLRALNFIATWDWVAEPLIVDLRGSGGSPSHNDNTSSSSSRTSSKEAGNGGMTAEAVSNLETRFRAWRTQLDPALNNVIWFVGTNLDETGVLWTQGARPPKVVAARLTALARASVELVRARGVSMGEADWKHLFQSPLGDFDFLISLKKHVQAKNGGGKASQFRNLQLQSFASSTDGDAIERLTFDPIALFLADLERCFGQQILFFYGGDASRIIAGLWNPRVLGKGREWRVKMGYSTIPVPIEMGGEREGEGGEGKVEGVVNQRGILAEIEMLGGGLVERIEVVKGLIVGEGDY